MRKLQFTLTLNGKRNDQFDTVTELKQHLHRVASHMGDTWGIYIGDAEDSTRWHVLTTNRLKFWIDGDPGKTGLDTTIKSVLNAVGWPTGFGQLVK